MATAFQPPHIEAQQRRQADLARRMNSADPVERWKAKEAALNSNAADYSRAAIAQARQNARNFEDQMRFYERSDRERNNYKPLPHGAKISK